MMGVKIFHGNFKSNVLVYAVRLASRSKKFTLPVNTYYILINLHNYTANKDKIYQNYTTFNKSII